MYLNNYLAWRVGFTTLNIFSGHGCCYMRNSEIIRENGKTIPNIDIAIL
jgi:hypothetical protein